MKKNKLENKFQIYKMHDLYPKFILLFYYYFLKHFLKKTLLTIIYIFNQNSAFPGVLGKLETSLIFSIPVIIITNLSNPNPKPP